MKTRVKSPDELKATVKKKYAEISRQSREENAASCCGAGGCCAPDELDYSIFADDYTEMAGYNADADLGLGCGLPTEFAQISEGDTVVDLGSGAGNDCFIARQLAGNTGRVIGLDMTEDMIEKARKNVDKTGYTNMEFVLGDIEEIPLDDAIADVVVSNCVMNLVPDKQKAFSETFRILKPGGHFSISDVVLKGDLPDSLKEDAEMYAGCVAGAIEMEKYLEIVERAGFENLVIQKEKKIQLPKDLLNKYLTEEETARYPDLDPGIYSISLYAEKPPVK